MFFSPPLKLQQGAADRRGPKGIKKFWIPVFKRILTETIVEFAYLQLKDTHGVAKSR